MLFNSLDFAIFLPIVFILYWFVFNKKLGYQNLFLLISSYVFYGWWDYRFLLLIVFSTAVDFTIALSIKHQKSASVKKKLLWLSIIINIGLLGFFKYYNFFIESFSQSFSFFGGNIDMQPLSIILPIGISFYTFQTLSYTIDVCRNKIEATRNFIAFAAFVTFFPQLVAGPIERATNLLPQFLEKRKFNYNQAVDGMRQILWGLFKKIVIADNCAVFANRAFDNYENLSGSTLLFGAFFFAIQIYGDFSGYSDIAIGTSKLFNFNLNQNFAFPYFSRDIAEFWRRWHISLSTWFRDYVYIPLGGSRGSKTKQIRNVFIIFLVSGFWHGANWTFLIWGFLNAIYFLPLMLTNNNRNYLAIVAEGKFLPSIKEMIKMMSTFLLTTFAWIFFRAESVSHAINYIEQIFSKHFFSIPEFDSPIISAKLLLCIIFIFFLAEWFQREKKHALEAIEGIMPKAMRWLLYISVVFLVFYFGVEENEFIYFQF